MGGSQAIYNGRNVATVRATEYAMAVREPTVCVTAPSTGGSLTCRRGANGVTPSGISNVPATQLNTAPALGGLLNLLTVIKTMRPRRPP